MTGSLGFGTWTERPPGARGSAYSHPSVDLPGGRRGHAVCRLTMQVWQQLSKEDTR